ncbi:MAG: PEP-CTERM sorting domain-containing protein [Armatimonadota bacterium]
MRFVSAFAPSLRTIHTRRTIAGASALLGLVGLACVGTSTTARAQSLNGQAVTVTLNGPAQTTVNRNLGTQTVTPTGVDFSYFGAVTITVTPNQVVFTNNPGNTVVYGAVPFVGFQIAQTGALPAAFTSVTLDAASNVSGFDASRISFDSTNIFANFQGLRTTSGQNVTLNLGFAPAAAAVPEPSEWLAMGMATASIGGLMVRARRRKAVKSSVTPVA